MPVIDEVILKRQIKSAQYSNLYVLYGNETYLKEKYVRLLSQKIVPKSAEFMNLHQFEGKEATVDEIAQASEALPFGCELTCVVVRDMDVESLSAVENKKLKELLSDLPPSSVLIFWEDTVNVQPKKSSKWKTFLSNAQKAGDVLELNKRSEAMLVKFICDTAAKRGCLMEKTAASYLYNFTGDDMQTLGNEIEKLCAYVGYGGSITAEEIRKLCVQDIEENIFDLSRALLQRDRERAFAIIDSLFIKKEEPISILFTLTSSFVDIYRVKIASIAGCKTEQIAAAFDYKGKEFRLKNAARSAGKLSVAQLRLCLDVLYNADYSLKSSFTDKRIVLEKTLVKILEISK